MKSTTTVRISGTTHSLLQELAEQSQTSMNAVIKVALDEYRKRLFWAQAGREFEHFRADQDAWLAEQEETAIWDASIADGLDSNDDR